VERGSILLRDAEEKDAALLTGWWNDGLVMAHAGFPRGLGITEAEVLRQLEEESDREGRRLIIELSGEPAGEMSYRNLGEETAEIGIKICREDKRNQGLGMAALQMLIGALFSSGYRFIVLDTNLKNARARHVYEKLGFKKTAVRENAWVDQLGEPQTAVCYALKQKDFKQEQRGASWEKEY